MGSYAIHLHNLHGTMQDKLIIDGSNVTIDGGYDTIPMYVHDCSYLEIRNWNLCRSRGGCLWFVNNHHCSIREVCAWDAHPEKNHKPFELHGSRHCEVVDCGAWGTGRKIFSGSWGGDDTVYKRCYGRWDGHKDGGNYVFAIAYNHYRNMFIDCIGECQRPQDPAHWFYAIFGADRIDNSMPAETVVKNCLAVSQLDVRGFWPAQVSGLSFCGCMDATNGKGVRADGLKELTMTWSKSPILDRLNAYADVNVMYTLSHVPSI